MAAPEITFAINKRPDSKFYFEVPIDGFDVAYPDKPKAWNFYVDMLRGVWDVGELAFSHYLIARDMGFPLIAVPAFQLRFLPHYGLSVHKAAGIDRPADLVAKRVGAADWGINPAVWMRGILAHQYEVPTELISWFEGDAQPSFPDMKYPHSARFRLGRLNPPADLARSQPDAYGWRHMVETHAVDAAILPGQGMDETETTRRLFADPLVEAREYVRQTGVIPINSVLVMRQEKAEEFPNLAPAVMEAAGKALAMHGADIGDRGDANYTYIPLWFVKEAGMYPFQQGFAPNRKAIHMMAAYCYEQGLVNKLYEPEELFAPGTV
ncbi:MAG: hypothetical protein ACHQ7M_09715 [Chloroflexota bacterium]